MVTTSTVRIISMQYKDSGGTTVYIAGKGVPIAIPEGATNIFCYINVNNSATAFSEDASITVYGLRVNEGSTVLPWEPYTGGMSSPNPNYPQEVQSVGDGEVMEVVSSVGGRNLVIGSSIPEKNDRWSITGWGGTFTSGDGEYRLRTEFGWKQAVYGLDKSLAGQYVTIQADIMCDLDNSIDTASTLSLSTTNAFHKGTNLYTQGSDVGWKHIEVTAKLSSAYIGFHISISTEGVGYGLTARYRIKNLKVEAGTTATPLTPPPEDVTEKNQADYLPCLFKTQVPAVLRGIDDVRDKLECREGVWGIWRYTISMRGLKWTEPRSPLGTAYENSFFAVADLWGMQINNYTNLLSSVFADVTSDRILDENVNGCYVYDGTIRARIVGVSTYDQFYQVINDAEFVIPLATPVWEPLPDYIQLQINSLVMYRGDTSCVYVTRTDVVPDMTVEYVQDTNKVIQELRTAIIALGGAT